MQRLKEKSDYLTVAFLLFITFAFPNKSVCQSDNEKLKIAIEETGAAIREGFSKGDISLIKMYHHPDVVKALSYTNHLVGRDAVMENLKKTLKDFNLEFQENNIESILLTEEIAVEQTLFTIKGTPKRGGKPFLFKGRTMVTYIKYDKSPTGWASIREIIQPANE